VFENLNQEVTSELKDWLKFLDDYAEFVEEEGGHTYLKEVPRGLNLPEHFLTDLRQASSQAVRVREHYNLGHHALPELYTFLDELRILVYRDFVPKESGVWGAFYRHPRLGFSVFVNVNTTPARQTFTLAHGLAHVLYHRHLPIIVCRRDFLSQREIEAERFANAWASHFLVPGKDLRKQAKLLGEISPEIALLLANHFRVSYSFILFRLQNEGLISKEERELWSKYRIEDLALRVGVPYHLLHLPTLTPRYPDLDRYPHSVLSRVRKAVENERLSVSGAAGLLKTDSTTVERELLARPKERDNPEIEELTEDLVFVSPGRKTRVGVSQLR
jgi:Zn-dependent peptidase ImmA (M78 family)